MITKSILVTLETGEEVIVNIAVPKNADEFDYVCEYLDRNMPTAVEWK